MIDKFKTLVLRISGTDTGRHGAGTSDEATAHTETELAEEKDADFDFVDEDPLEMPITGTLDLHTFSPKQLPALLGDYLDACIEREILDLRIIHGKGKGILRDRVRSILKKHPLVDGLEEAPPEAGGWGATLVRLKKPRA